MSAMPLLTLKISGPTPPRTVTVDQAGATLGRGADCTIVLADERRAISRLQARIEWRGESYTVIDTGGNPTLVNGNALDASREAILCDGDTLSIDAYLIEIVLERDPASATDAAQRADTVWAPLRERGDTQTNATPTTPPAPKQNSQPFAAVPDEPFFAMPAAALTVLRVRAEHASRAGSAEVTKVVKVAKVAEEAAEKAPEITPEKAPVWPGPPSAVVIQTGATSSDAVMAALLEGLGIERANIGSHTPPEFARLIGTLLRDALQGTMEALRAQSGVAQQIPAAMKSIGTRGNNLLESFPDAASALVHMLGSGGNASLAQGAMLREAFIDLRNHELACAAAMHATLHGGPHGELFGESFARAYEAQLDALAAANAAPADRRIRDASDGR
jgi:type VI secretion system protein